MLRSTMNGELLVGHGLRTHLTPQPFPPLLGYRAEHHAKGSFICFLQAHHSAQLWPPWHSFMNDLKNGSEPSYALPLLITPFGICKSHLAGSILGQCTSF